MSVRIHGTSMPTVSRAVIIDRRRQSWNAEPRTAVEEPQRNSTTSELMAISQTEWIRIAASKYLRSLATDAGEYILVAPEEEKHRGRDAKAMPSVTSR